MTLRRWPWFYRERQDLLSHHQIRAHFPKISLPAEEDTCLTFLYFHFSCTFSFGLLWPILTYPSRVLLTLWLVLMRGYSWTSKHRKELDSCLIWKRKGVKWVERSWVRREGAFSKARGHSWEPSPWANTQERIMEGFGVLWVLADMTFMDQKEE